MRAAASQGAEDFGDLFSSAQRQPYRASDARQRAESKHARDIERLVPVAREVLQLAGKAGATIDNVRTIAANRGLITGAEQGRALSWLSGVMKAAGAKPTALFRRSRMPRSHRIPKVVWVAAEFFDEALHGEMPEPALEGA